MFHKPYLRLLKKQAERLDINLITLESEGVEEKELVDLRELIWRVKNEVDGIVVGGIASNYQGKRIKDICEELGLKFYAPLWDLKGEEIWNLLLKEKFKVILTKISCEGLSKEFLGKIINKNLIEKIKILGEKYRFRIDFEGGEAESAVLFMPEFKNKMKIKYSIKSEGKYRHYLDIKEVV